MPRRGVTGPPLSNPPRRGGPVSATAPTRTTGAPPGHRPRQRGFWLVAAALLVLMGAAGAPSPLFVVFQARWHFTAAGPTAAFAVYALALLVALLTTGGLSDPLGRKPVLAVGLLLV